MGNMSIMGKAHSKQVMINVSLDVFAHMFADWVCAACAYKHANIRIYAYKYTHEHMLAFFLFNQAFRHLAHIYAHTHTLTQRERPIIDTKRQYTSLHLFQYFSPITGKPFNVKKTRWSNG